MTKRKNPDLGRLDTDASHGPLRKRMPDDFRTVAPDLTRGQLGERYDVTRKIIARWLEEADVECQPSDRNRDLSAARSALARKRPTFVNRNNAYLTGPVDRPRKDTTRAGQAADYLRRFGPVIRCTPAGRYSETGAHWLRGSTVLNAAEVVERAEWLGFGSGRRRAA